MLMPDGKAAAKSKHTMQNYYSQENNVMETSKLDHFHTHKKKKEKKKSKLDHDSM